jgi:hypothetical protein
MSKAVPDAIYLHYEIDKCGDCYGAAAYEEIWRRGAPVLRQVAFFSGDTAATLEGRERVYVVAIAGEADTLAALEHRLAEPSPLWARPMRRGPLKLGVERGEEPLAYNGKIDAEGRLHPSDDSSMLHHLS